MPSIQCRGRPDADWARLAPAMADDEALVLHPLVGDLSCRLLRNFCEQVAPNIVVTPL